MSLAFVFPGQGSQSIGMATQLSAEFPVVGSVFQQASEALGYDLFKLVQDGPEEVLNSTNKTQPALLTASYAIWKVWQDKNGPQPALMAGHSLGEYSALVCSGVLDFIDAVKLVADRGRFMQAAVPEGVGAMAAILGLDNAVVIEVCENVSTEDEIVAAANFNSTGQVVIAGHATAVERAVIEAKEVGAKRSIVLPVSVPSHCELMRPAALQLEQRLTGIPLSAGNIPVIHNVDSTIKNSANEIKQALKSQLSMPVRWVETIETMVQQGVIHIIECGPGKVLSGLIKRIDRQLNVYPVYDAETIDIAITRVTE